MQQTSLSEFDALKAQVQVFVGPTKDITVTDAATNAIASGVLKTIRDFKKQIETRRAAATAPLNTRLKEIRAYSAAIEEPLDEAELSIKKKISNWADEEKRRIAEEQIKAERVRAEAARKADAERREMEARAQAAERAARENLERERAQAQALAKKFGADADEVAKKQEEEAVANKARLETQRLQEQARFEREQRERDQEAQAKMKQLQAEKPKNLRQVAKYEILNPMELPHQYLCPDTARITADVKAGIRNIPGVRIWLEDTVVVR